MTQKYKFCSSVAWAAFLLSSKWPGTAVLGSADRGRFTIAGSFVGKCRSGYFIAKLPDFFPLFWLTTKVKWLLELLIFPEVLDPQNIIVVSEIKISYSEWVIWTHAKKKKFWPIQAKMEYTERVCWSSRRGRVGEGEAEERGKQKSQEVWKWELLDSLKRCWMKPAPLLFLWLMERVQWTTRCLGENRESWCMDPLRLHTMKRGLFSKGNLVS